MNHPGVKQPMNILRNSTLGRKGSTGNPIPASQDLPIPGEEATSPHPFFDAGLSLDPETISTSPGEDSDERWASLESWDEAEVRLDDEDEEAEDYGYLDPWDACVDPDAKGAVERWRIVAVGHRPEDYLARDCLYRSLRLDHRVPWFRRYLKRPAPWMESLVAHLPNKADRHQALQWVVLDYLHKLHLARLYPVLTYQYDEEGWETTLFRRLWRCTPYTVQVERRNGGKKNIRGCGYPRLCPWCHARKVVRLHEVIRLGPLKEPSGKYLLLGKPRPFAEISGGIDGSWEQADWLAYTSDEKVRGHYGRYFGRSAGRAAETKKVLADTLLAAARELGAIGGLLTHQLGSAQLGNGQRSFLHDLGLVAQLDSEVGLALLKDTGGTAMWESVEPLQATSELTMNVRWLVLPADQPTSLRVALAGSSASSLRKLRRQAEEGLEGDEGHSFGIRGALNWQPTFLLDDQMWVPYVQEIEKQRLYLPFGSWQDSMAVAGATERMSTDRRFGKAQSARLVQSRQQKGNRHRRREAEDRRADLLNVARSLWDRVLMDVAGARGRPGYRKRLEMLMQEQGHCPSPRDMKWLMGQLTQPAGRR
jgi:hypothetical protein